jgi:hypothetical protein
MCFDCHKTEEQLEDEEHEDHETKRHLTQSKSQSAFKWKVKGNERFKEICFG